MTQSIDTTSLITIAEHFNEIAQSRIVPNPQRTMAKQIVRVLRQAHLSVKPETALPCLFRERRIVSGENTEAELDQIFPECVPLLDAAIESVHTSLTLAKQSQFEVSVPYNEIPASLMRWYQVKYYDTTVSDAQRRGYGIVRSEVEGCYHASRNFLHVSRLLKQRIEEYAITEPETLEILTCAIRQFRPHGEV